MSPRQCKGERGEAARGHVGMVTWGHGANKERPGGPEARWTRERQGSKGNRRPEDWLGAKSAQRCNCGGAACKSAKVSAEEPRGGTGRTRRGPEAQRLGGPERGRAQRGIGDRMISWGPKAQCKGANRSGAPVQKCKGERGGTARGHGANKERPGGPEARWTRERQGSKGNRRPDSWRGFHSRVAGGSLR
jgi:hypothetical protein